MEGWFLGVAKGKLLTRLMGKVVASIIEVMRAGEAVRASRAPIKAEVVRRNHVHPETARHSLTERTVNPTLARVLDMLRPEPWSDLHKGSLATLRALYDSNNLVVAGGPSPEIVLPDASKLSRDSATVGRSVPLEYWQTRRYLDLDSLLKEGKRRGQPGLFLDLTSQPSSDLGFENNAKKSGVEVIDFSRRRPHGEERAEQLRIDKAGRIPGFS
jgi:hypothetical protein